LVPNVGWQTRGFSFLSQVKAKDREQVHQGTVWISQKSWSKCSKNERKTSFRQHEDSVVDSRASQITEEQIPTYPPDLDSWRTLRPTPAEDDRRITHTLLFVMLQLPLFFYIKQILIKGWTSGSEGQESWMLTDLFHKTHTLKKMLMSRMARSEPVS